ncbi:flavin reductase family protein [Methylobacterium nonmethylotrophicum]|uniref:Flavin reductase family protein n=1 Tax=Methylobacterium nonmethylotrophicum TaxID=1141884 RepID=A0A4Z0NWL6_9HYPH|nr:flavin reductase family protein [Methylobacterium nonmethylotrophicum]TGE02260.1 flavin reductase family protein [Methylobacterium nonmethylotrophicum]
MDLHFDDLLPRDRYRLLTALVTPRPIALVTTRSASGTDNAAPISFFQVLAEEPPIVVLSFNLRSDGNQKDTPRNIAETGEFVVNLVDEGLVAAMNVCAAEFPPDESEIAAAGLTLLPCTGVAPGRISEAPASLGCRTHTVIDLSPERRIVLGQVVSLQARDELFTPDGRHLRDGAFLPVGRLYADLYARTGDRFAVPRVTPEEARRA